MDAVSLHQFLEGWFAGRIPVDEFEKNFRRRFDDSSILIPPSGATLNVDDFVTGVRDRHGSNESFKIQIRNVQLRVVTAEYIISTYEEWQRNALASKPADNARLATVVFRRSESGFKWTHIHETWLPDSVTDLDPFDF